MPFRILSLSGGGIRGVFQAVYHREVATALDRPLRTYFDLIAGTSTGAVVALGVALNVELDRLVALYRTHGPEIFPPGRRRTARRWYSWLRRGPRYSDRPLFDALTEVFGSKTLAECTPPVIIAATRLERFQIRSFTTVTRAGLAVNSDFQLSVVDVARASCAAPLFFPAVQAANDPGAEEGSYVDGGLWANTPSLLAVMRAHRHFGIPFADMRVISIGTGEVPMGAMRIEFNKMLRAKMVEPILDIMFSTQSEVADQVAAILVNEDKETVRLNGEKNYLRVNVVLPRGIDLDDVERTLYTMPALAQQLARNEGDRLTDLLMR